MKNNTDVMDSLEACYFRYLTNMLKEEGVIKDTHEFEHSAGLIDMVCVLNV